MEETLARMPMLFMTHCLQNNTARRESDEKSQIVKRFMEANGISESEAVQKLLAESLKSIK